MEKKREWKWSEVGRLEKEIGEEIVVIEGVKDGRLGRNL
jgi:hypothetical protein